LDHPSVVEDKRGRSWVGDNAKFVDYCLRRMSIDPTCVFRDYILKCYPQKLPGDKVTRMSCVAACSQYRFEALKELTSLRAMVVLGSLGCETITGHKTIGDYAGAEWAPVSLLMRQHVPEVWIGYSPGILREKASEAGAIYRVIFKAAEAAGLNPHADLSIAPYEFPI
jgi:uracil-DNA glycosylase